MLRILIIFSLCLFILSCNGKDNIDPENKSKLGESLEGEKNHPTINKKINSENYISKINFDEFIQIDPDFKWIPDNPTPTIDLDSNFLLSFHFRNGTTIRVTKNRVKPILEKVEYFNSAQPTQTVTFSKKGIPASMTVAGISLNYDWDISNNSYKLIGVSHPTDRNYLKSNRLINDNSTTISRASSIFNYLRSNDNQCHDSTQIIRKISTFLGIKEALANEGKKCPSGDNFIDSLCDYADIISGAGGILKLIGFNAEKAILEKSVALALRTEINIASKSVLVMTEGGLVSANISPLMGRVATIVPVFSNVLLGIGALCGMNTAFEKISGCSIGALLFGDPHIITLDGLKYSFQAAGDFVLAKSLDGNIEIQARFAHSTNSKRASFNVSTAIKIHGNIISIYKDNILMYVNGESIDVDTTDKKHLNLLNDVMLKIDKNFTITLISKDGTKIEVIKTGGGIGLKTHLIGGFVGLYGDGDGDPRNDLRTADGELLSDKITLYDEFAKSWVVKPEDSLFIPGIDDFAIAGFVPPSKIMTLADFDSKSVSDARQTCIDSGVAPDSIIDACAFDILITGSTDYVAAAKGASAPKLVALSNGQLPNQKSTRDGVFNDVGWIKLKGTEISGSIRSKTGQYRGGLHSKSKKEIAPGIYDIKIGHSILRNIVVTAGKTTVVDHSTGWIKLKGTEISGSIRSKTGQYRGSVHSKSKKEIAPGIYDIKVGNILLSDVVVTAGKVTLVEANR